MVFILMMMMTIIHIDDDDYDNDDGLYNESVWISMMNDVDDRIHLYEDHPL